MQLSYFVGKMNIPFAEDGWFEIHFERTCNKGSPQQLLSRRDLWTTLLTVWTAMKVHVREKLPSQLNVNNPCENCNRGVIVGQKSGKVSRMSVETCYEPNPPAGLLELFGCQREMIRQWLIVHACKAERLCDILKDRSMGFGLPSGRKKG